MATKKKTASKPMWYDQRPAAIAFAAIAWLGAYYFALRALDTASTWHYLALFVLLVFGLNRFVAAVRPHRG